MTATMTFPAIDLTGVTARPLVETLKKDPETPTFNAILRRKRRAVSQLRNMRWPGETMEPDLSADEEPAPPEPAGEPDSAPTPDGANESAPEPPGQE
ncbi:hypothetical protein [Amycolatopsis dendrobii]|uniref:Uncharacterized protein n=1 Tax=Amycolatopsis dendrobii TaxID=2760662 RepID=A0A7W3VVA5_9PSEU|nr:hypothetical protein [Amycolatopsis dendrobii]MBB1153457.1 hypothetical protein [Amycolatopsis dendrobii]